MNYIVRSGPSLVVVELDDSASLEEVAQVIIDEFRTTGKQFGDMISVYRVRLEAAPVMMNVTETFLKNAGVEPWEPKPESPEVTVSYEKWPFPSTTTF